MYRRKRKQSYTAVLAESIQEMVKKMNSPTRNPLPEDQEIMDLSEASKFVINDECFTMEEKAGLLLELTKSKRLVMLLCTLKGQHDLQHNILRKLL